MTNVLMPIDGHAEMLGSFSIIDNVYIVPLIDNFDGDYLDLLEARLLKEFHVQHEIRGVIFNFGEVITTDQDDLRRLEEMLKAIKLMGGRIGLCGINPGLAAVIVRFNLNFQREVIGREIDDILKLL